MEPFHYDLLLWTGVVCLAIYIPYILLALWNVWKSEKGKCPKNLPENFDIFSPYRYRHRNIHILHIDQSENIILMDDKRSVSVQTLISINGDDIFLCPVIETLQTQIMNEEVELIQHNLENAEQELPQQPQEDTQIPSAKEINDVEVLNRMTAAYENPTTSSRIPVLRRPPVPPKPSERRH